MKTYTVTAQQDDVRLDVFCKNCSPLSRSKISEMITLGQILLNNRPAKPKSKIKMGDTVIIYDYIPKETQIKAIDMPLNIIYEDDHLLVVHKERGLVVHPAKGIAAPTLLNGLVNHFRKQGLAHTPGLVHRIDKDTEGLLVVAKETFVHQELAKQLLDKTLNRHYIAVCNNHANFKRVSVTEPIGVHPADSTKMSVHGINAKHASTHFECLENHETYCVLQCILKTGRTHQIRVHAAFLNHPLIGDKVYGTNKDGLGQALCAYHLSFIHPISKELVSFTIPYDNTLIYARECLSY